MTELAVGGDSAIVEANDPFDDGEAEASTVAVCLLARGIGAIKTFEDMGEMFGRDTEAGVTSNRQDWCSERHCPAGSTRPGSNEPRHQLRAEKG